MKKRRFSDCAEMKATVGSQFLQYLGKVIIGSELNMLRQKLALHEASHEYRHLCGGCRVPVDDHEDILQSCPSCMLTVRCRQPFCTTSASHECASCGKPACLGLGNLDPACNKCGVIVCNQCCSDCESCVHACRSCSPTTKEPARKWASPNWQTMQNFYCPEHMVERNEYRRVFEICQACCEDWLDYRLPGVGSCKADNCDNYACKHNPAQPAGGRLLCPKHLAEK